MAKIIVDPLTRIEGHLKVEAVVEGGETKDAHVSGMLWRGIEVLLQGRDPRDAVTITQRICGVCPTAHATASTLCLDDAFGVAGRIPDNGRIIRNLIGGSNYIQSHILHFYHLAALDYVDVTAVGDYEGSSEALSAVKDFIGRATEKGDLSMLGPFYPRYEGDYRLSAEQNQAAVEHYVKALDMRRVAHELSAIYSGIMPHQKAMLPGGVTAVPTADNIASFLWKLQQLRHFIDNVYVPDVLMVAGAYPDYFGIGAGCGNYLSYGAFDLESGEPDLTKRERLINRGRVSTDLMRQAFDPNKITEDVTSSWYNDADNGLHPSNGNTRPEPFKQDGYSWLKSPRYDGTVYEVGPLSRMLVSYAAGNTDVRGLVDGALSAVGGSPSDLFSTLGRHAARALECKLVADKMAQWVLELKPGDPVYAEHSLPDSSQGMGIWDAPRGALGHWINIEGGKIKNYQAVVPTTWNCSPRDSQGQPGPVEQALIGTRIQDEENPFEIGRIVRSFDPCLACAIHVVTPKGRELARFRVC